jgi:hypothetical protein
LFLSATICLPFAATNAQVTTPASDFDFDASKGEITGYHGADANVVIPDSISGVSVTSIGHAAFYGQNITSITMPDTVTKIQSYAFYQCRSLKNVTYSKKLTDIWFYAFAYCNSLTSISLPDSLTTLNSKIFVKCTNLTDVILPKHLRDIGVGTFAYTALTSITFPDSVISIASQSFYGCSKLASATFAGNAPSYGLGPYIFDNTAPSFSIYYYEGKTGFSTPIYQGYPCKPVYHVHIASGIYGGDITCESIAAVGNTVSLTITPDLGNSLYSLYYIDTSGKHVISGTSFVMPASDVTIYAKFILTFVYTFFAISIVFFLGLVTYGLWLAFRNR